MTGRQKRQISDQEIEQEKERNYIRERLCRQKGVALVQLDVNEPEPWRLVERIRSALNRTSRLLAQSEVNLSMKRDLAPRISHARQMCDQIRAHVREEDGLKLYADLWQDRQYVQVAGLDEEPARRRNGRRRRYKVGMAVTHAAFGAGEVIDVSGDGEDATRSRCASARTWSASF